MTIEADMENGTIFNERMKVKNEMRTETGFETTVETEFKMTVQVEMRIRAEI